MTDALDPGDFNIGDIVRVAFTDKSKTLDNLAKADIVPDEPAIEEQITPPTDNELAEIEQLCRKAAEVQDKLKAATGDMPGELKKLRAQIKEKFLRHGMSDIDVDGRHIELTESSNRKPTRKAIIDALQKKEVEKLTDEQRRDSKQLKDANNRGKTNALNLWNSIEPTVSQSIKIPDPAPPQEPESPY